jgi:hypothetical protein
MSAEPPAAPPPDTSRDWRVWFGLASTLFWLWLGLMYVGIVVGFENFLVQPSEALGSFLEGAFAPLAFLWLVIGFFLQQRELRQNNSAILLQYEQMRRQVEYAGASARAIEANALHQEQETLLLVADHVHRQLGSVLGLLWMSSRLADPDTPVPEEQVSDLWSRLGAGDSEAFARQCMAIYFRNREDRAFVWSFFFGTPVRTRHSETVLECYGRVLESARGCDPKGIITSALLGSGCGQVYRVLQELKALGPP